MAFKRNSNNVKDERMRLQQVDLQVVLVLCSLELQKLPYSIGHAAAWEKCQNYVDLDIVTAVFFAQAIGFHRPSSGHG